MKKQLALLAALALLILGTIWVRSIKAQVAYADTDCPVCGSNEVLDFGETDKGQHCHCYDCGQEFYLIPASDYE